MEDRNGKYKSPIFVVDPWSMEGHTTEFCYDCHDELVHNPVFLPQDVEGFSKLVKIRNLDERQKTESKAKLAGRIKLLHEALETGIRVLLDDRQ